MIRVLLLLCLPQLALAAQGDAWQLLEKASQAARQLSYKGVFVYQAGSNMTSIQITHTNLGGQGEFSRVVVLDGEAREVLRQGEEAVIYRPKKEKTLIEKRRIQSGFPAIVPRVSDELKANYQISVGEPERILARETVAITLSPHDALRYASRFWVDTESGLVLKAALLNGGEMVEQVGFSQLQIMPVVDMEWFRPNTEQNKTYEVKPEQLVQASEDDNRWVVGQLPPGFRKIKQVMRTLPGRQQPVRHMVFCDGLASVSLFIEPVGRHHPGNSTLAQGATNMVSKTISDYQIVVLGEVPAPTLLQIVNSVTGK